MLELQTLLDEREITRGLSLFARILDSKRWDELPRVFAQDLSIRREVIWSVLTGDPAIIAAGRNESGGIE